MHKSDGVVYYSKSIDRGAAIAGPLLVKGRLLVRDGCVIFHGMKKIAAIPIFLPDAHLDTKTLVLKSGGRRFHIDGRKVKFSGEFLSSKLTNRQRLPHVRKCGRMNALFVYGSH